MSSSIMMFVIIRLDNYYLSMEMLSNALPRWLLWSWLTLDWFVGWHPIQVTQFLIKNFWWLVSQLKLWRLSFFHFSSNWGPYSVSLLKPFIWKGEKEILLDASEKMLTFKLPPQINAILPSGGNFPCQEIGPSCKGNMRMGTRLKWDFVSMA